MGGNNALIIDEVTDLDAAVNLTIQSAFISAGQRCTCARRLLVKRGATGDAFLQRLVTVAGRLRVSRWDAEPQPFMGGVISSNAAERMMAVQQALLELGATPLLVMTRPEGNNALLMPGILDITGVDGVPDEEYFGPLTCVMRYDNFDDALRLANHTRFRTGCGTGVARPCAVRPPAAGSARRNRQLEQAADRCIERRAVRRRGGLGQPSRQRLLRRRLLRPMASLESSALTLPSTLPPGLNLNDAQSGNREA